MVKKVNFNESKLQQEGIISISVVQGLRVENVANQWYAFEITA